MAANTEDTLMIHKNEIVFYDQIENRHYRLNPDNIVKITFDYVEMKKFFGLKKDIIEFIKFDINDKEIPEVLILREDYEPSFRRYLGGLRSWAEDNKLEVEVNRFERT